MSRKIQINNRSYCLTDYYDAYNLWDQLLEDNNLIGSEEDQNLFFELQNHNLKNYDKNFITRILLNNIYEEMENV